MNNKITLTFFENSMLQDMCELELKRLTREYKEAEGDNKKYNEAVRCILHNILMKLRDEL